MTYMEGSKRPEDAVRSLGVGVQRAMSHHAVAGDRTGSSGRAAGAFNH